MPIAVTSRELGEEGSFQEFHLDVVNFKGDTAYPTGGSLNVSTTLGVQKGRLLALVSLSHGGYIWDYDPGTDKLKFYQQSAATGALTEVPNNANLSAVVYRALMIFS